MELRQMQSCSRLYARRERRGDTRRNYFECLYRHRGEGAWVGSLSANLFPLRLLKLFCASRGCSYRSRANGDQMVRGEIGSRVEHNIWHSTPARFCIQEKSFAFESNAH